MKQASKPRTDYKCTQAELYAICRIAWANCLIHLTRFFQFKTFYTQQFIDDRLAEVNYAASLPDPQMRGEASEIAHIQLKEKAELCLIAWQSLKAYIQDAFPTNQQKPKLEAAGSKLYPKAATYDWESITKLMGQATKFITDNNTALLNNGGMPPTFPAEVEALELDFNTIYNTFQTEQQASEVLTTTKINANNLIFEKLMKMLSDGKKIFRLERAIQEQFIWEQILELVTPPSPQPKVTLIFATNQTNPDKMLFQIKAAADGKKIDADFGDSSPIMQYTVNSINYTLLGHTFINAGNFQSKLTGEIPAFNELLAPDNKITASNLPEGLKLKRLDMGNNLQTSYNLPDSCDTIENILLFNNKLDQQSINALLIKVNGFNTNNGNIDLSGPDMATPSGQGLTAKNQLIARGWTVVTN